MEGEANVANIDERIEQSIRAFADELRQLIREAAHEAIDEALANTSSSSPPARRSDAKPSAAKMRPAKKKRPAAAKRRPRPKGTRRTNEQMQRDLDALRDRIRHHPGQTAMQIGAALGMASREISRPIKTLLAAGELRKTGVKSHTRYFPVDSAPSEPRRNNSHPRLS
jgi:hypothetical protein